MDEIAVGKTIAQVVDLGYSGQGLIFTDGTAVELRPTGYESDGVQIEESSEMGVLHEQALQENHRRDTVLRNQRARERYEAGEMKGMELVVYEMYLDQIKSMWASINRQVYGA